MSVREKRDLDSVRHRLACLPITAGERERALRWLRIGRSIAGWLRLVRGRLTRDGTPHPRLR
jgi:hypothetical protein